MQTLRKAQCDKPNTIICQTERRSLYLFRNKIQKLSLSL